MIHNFFMGLVFSVMQFEVKVVNLLQFWLCQIFWSVSPPCIEYMLIRLYGPQKTEDYLRILWPNYVVVSIIANDHFTFIIRVHFQSILICLTGQAYSWSCWPSWCWEEYSGIWGGSTCQQVMASKMCFDFNWFSSGAFRSCYSSSHGWVPPLPSPAWFNGG